MQKKLLVLSCIEGASVMAAELCGAKLLAPIFGGSLYVWATVMGITLLALAAGYFWGGWLSAKNSTNITTLFNVLLASSLFLLSMPLISHYLVPRISYLPFIPGLIISTGVLLFMPVFFMGASSPLFILLQCKEGSDAGKVSGMVYAVSTLGGIISTFLCGFYLIPHFGLQASVFIFGLLLFILNWIFLKTIQPLHFIFLFGLIYLNYQILQQKSNTIAMSDSIMGKLVVEDLNRGEESIRLLKINEIIQTEMNLKTKRSASAYIKVIDSLIQPAFSNGNALVLGLGGGLTSNLLMTKNYQTEAVEFDSRIIQASENYFYLNPKVNLLCEDARRYLNHCDKSFDLILVDVFKAEEPPSYVITSESLFRIKQNLKPLGRLYINWHGYSRGTKGMGTSILYHTLIHAGFKVKLCSNSLIEDQRNLIFVASLQPLPYLPYELKEDGLITQLVNTDDLPLLERYNADANKSWRTLYLRHYQSGWSY